MMVTMREEAEYSDQWYLDSGCLTHMPQMKDWFVKINQALKNKVKFADDNILAT